MQLQIETATPAALETLVGFNQAMAWETEGKRLDPDRLRAGVAAVLADTQRGLYLLARSAPSIVGGLLLTWEWSDWRNAWFWWIQSVYVRPEARGRGVYRALHDEVLRRARAAGNVCGLRLYVDHDNAAAQACYAALGMRPGRYRFYEQML